MKYPNNKKNSRGVSIIEIVVSMVLLMTVMFSLAFVYPNGRKLTTSSDYRTKATEIARSILEETKLIPFDHSTATPIGAGTATTNSIVLVKNPADPAQSANFILLDPFFTPNGQEDGLHGPLHSNNVANLQWPYHHLSQMNNGALVPPSIGVTWDATVQNDGDTKPVCPFFITTALPTPNNLSRHANRPFFLLSQDVTDTNGNTYGRSIQVTGGGSNVPADINLDHPTLLLINVIVYWVDKKANNFVINYINLCDSRTYNAY